MLLTVPTRQQLVLLVFKIAFLFADKGRGAVRPDLLHGRIPVQQRFGFWRSFFVRCIGNGCGFPLTLVWLLRQGKASWTFHNLDGPRLLFALLGGLYGCALGGSRIGRTGRHDCFIKPTAGTNRVIPCLVSIKRIWGWESVTPLSSASVSCNLTVQFVWGGGASFHWNGNCSLPRGCFGEGEGIGGLDLCRSVFGLSQSKVDPMARPFISPHNPTPPPIDPILVLDRPYDSYMSIHLVSIRHLQLSVSAPTPDRIGVYNYTRSIAFYQIKNCRFHLLLLGVCVSQYRDW